MNLKRILLTGLLSGVWRTLDLADGLRDARVSLEHYVDLTHGHQKELGECDRAQRAGYWLARKLGSAGDGVERLAHRFAAGFDALQERSGLTFDEMQAPLVR